MFKSRAEVEKIKNSLVNFKKYEDEGSFLAYRSRLIYGFNEENCLNIDSCIIIALIEPSAS